MAPSSRLFLAFAAAAALVKGVPVSVHVNAPPTTRRNGPRATVINLPIMRSQILANNGTSGDFDVLEHLAGISPYFNAPGVSLDASPPDQCTVSSATYLIRHSNIYANDFDYETYLEPFISKLANFTSKSDFTSLPQIAFLANWTSPITNATEQVEAVTPSGLDTAGAFGSFVRTIYPTLLPNSTTSNASSFNVWASSSERTVGSAEAFIVGAFGPISGNLSATSPVVLVEVPEGENESANSLTPHESCTNFKGSRGSDQSGEWIGIYTAPIVSRLNEAVPAFNFTATDVYAMQQLCGYETVIRNSSDFCQAFEEIDWLGFEYANDLMYFYSLGYGLDEAPALGMPWVTASTALLNNSTPVAQNQSVYFSFTHREEPPFVLTALGLFNNTAYTPGADVNSSMPSTQINYNRAWKTSNILPFLGHVALERLECTVPSPSSSNSTLNPPVNSTTSYVRALVNSAPIPFPGCQSGPGASCALSDYLAYIGQRQELYGDFVGACALNTSEVTNATDTLGIYWGQGPGTNLTTNTTTSITNGTESAITLESLSQILGL